MNKSDLGYSLLDSGSGFKIEQLGSHVLMRPSTWCVWSRGDTNIQVTSAYEPKSNTNSTSGPNSDAGWSREIAPWSVPFPELDVVMEARLQRNGQIGIFPEHASYLPRIAKSLKPGMRVLNLFAFTGLASMVALKKGAHVTHVDILKPVLDWAARNADLNEVDRSQFRLIPDEAVSFLAREVRRGSTYDVVIMDPPSFSRISKGKDWQLDSVLRELLTAALTILSPHGSLYFTCHHGELAGVVIENLLLEIEKDKKPHTLTSELLQLTEQKRVRSIPAGFLTSMER